MHTRAFNKLVGSRRNYRGLKRRKEESELVTVGARIRDCRMIVVPRQENSGGGKERGRSKLWGGRKVGLVDRKLHVLPSHKFSVGATAWKSPPA